jgi:DNA-binding NarL/FixJ family response regulator
MSQTVEKPLVAIIDSKSLRRASIASFLEPWANSNDLRLTPFNLDQAREALHAETNLRMVILNVGGESIAVPENLQQLKELRKLATGVPFTVISDREDAQEVAAALGCETNGFIHSGIDAELAREALSFILHGGSYFPPSAVRRLLNFPPSAVRRLQSGQAENPQGGLTDSSQPESNHGGDGTNDLTVREQEVLKRVCLGESNKMIGRHLGMMEPTVKVYVGQLMRKFHASNRTQLALSLNVSTEGSVEQWNRRPKRPNIANEGCV